MRATRRRLTKRNAPRLAGTGRTRNLLLLVFEKVNISAKSVNSSDHRFSRRAQGGAQ